MEEATLPRLVSIYSGFPRFPRLCHARSAPPVCIILYLFRLVTSYTRAPVPRTSLLSSKARSRSSLKAVLPRAMYTRGKWWVEEEASFSSQAFTRIASYTRAPNGLYGLQENPRAMPYHYDTFFRIFPPCVLVLLLPRNIPLYPAFTTHQCHWVYTAVISNFHSYDRKFTRDIYTFIKSHNIFLYLL